MLSPPRIPPASNSTAHRRSLAGDHSCNRSRHPAPVHRLRLDCGRAVLLTLIAFVTVLTTRRIPRPLFDAIAMTFRYEWRTVSYALFLRADYPPFDFQPTASDDGANRTPWSRSPTRSSCPGGGHWSNGCSPCRTTWCCSS